MANPIPPQLPRQRLVSAIDGCRELVEACGPHRALAFKLRNAGTFQNGELLFDLRYLVAQHGARFAYLVFETKRRTHILAVDAFIASNAFLNSLGADVFKVARGFGELVFVTSLLPGMQFRSFLLGRVAHKRVPGLMVFRQPCEPSAFGRRELRCFAGARLDLSSRGRERLLDRRRSIYTCQVQALDACALGASFFFCANDLQTLAYLVDRYTARLRCRCTLGSIAPSSFERIEDPFCACRTGANAYARSQAASRKRSVMP